MCGEGFSKERTMGGNTWGKNLVEASIKVPKYQKKGIKNTGFVL